MQYRLYVMMALLLLAACRSSSVLTHTPPAQGNVDDGVELTAAVAADADSVVVRPMRVDGQKQYFTYRMRHLDDGSYYVFVPKYMRGMPIDRTHGQRPQGPRGEHFGDTFFYNIVVYSHGVGTVFPPNGYYKVRMR